MSRQLTKLNAAETCPDRRSILTHLVHVVRAIGSFGAGYGYGYECETCFKKWTRLGRKRVDGWPAPDLAALDHSDD